MTQKQPPNKYKVEQELRDSNARYRSLFENCPIPLIEVDFSEIKKMLWKFIKAEVADVAKFLDDQPQIIMKMLKALRFTDVNKAAINLYEAKNKEELQSNLGVIVNDQVIKLFKQGLINILKGVNIFEAELEAKTLTKKPIFVAIKAFIPPVFKKDSDRVIIAITEITGRKQFEEDLKFKSMLVDSATDSIFVLDETGKIILVNEAAYKDRGFTKDELIGKPIDQVDAPRFKEIVRQNMVKLLKTGYIRVDTQHVKKDGSLMDVEVNARTVDYKGKRVIVGVLRDITERKQAEDLRNSLNSINMIINSTLEVEKIMYQAINESAIVLGVEKAAIDLKEGSYWVPKFLYGFPRSLLKKKFTDKDAPFMALPAKQKRTLIINNVDEEEVIDTKLLKQLGIKSLLSVPLIVRGEVIGLISYFFTSKPSGFNDLQIDFANKLATALSLAIENARLYVAQRDIADILQEAVLKVPEVLPGIEFNHLYTSATEATRVGGDFYDLFEVNHNRIGILIGDVSGKGIEAATLATLVKNTIKAFAYHEKSPSKILSKTNKVAIKSSAPATFITVFFGILDTRLGKITYCNAGHPQPILKRPTNETATLVASSSTIGIFEEEQEYKNQQIDFSPDDHLILYTDGVTEARRNKEFFTEERLMSLIKKLEVESVRHYPKIIFDEVLKFADGKLFDDLVILSLALTK